LGRRLLWTRVHRNLFKLFWYVELALTFERPFSYTVDKVAVKEAMCKTEWNYQINFNGETKY
jgi:hypothetical protein